MIHTPAFKKSNLRIVASLTLLVFFFTQNAIAFPITLTDGVVLAKPELSRIDIPEELGFVKEIKGDFSPTQPVLVYIEDAHANYDAQLKTKELLKWLYEHHHIDLAFLEGATSQFNPDRFRFFPNDKLNRELADALARKGLVTGAELFLLESGKNYTALGMESTPLYAENLKSFRRVLGAERSANEFVREIKRTAAQVENHLLNSELKDFLKSHHAYQDGSETPWSFVQTLQKEAKKHMALDLLDPYSQLHWPQLVRLAEIRNVESAIKPADIEKESEAFLSQLREWKISDEMIHSVENLVKRQMGRVAHAAADQNEPGPRLLLERLYLEASRHEIVFANYPNLRRKLALLIFQDEINPQALDDEMDRLSGALLEKLAKSEVERAVISVVKDIRLLERCFRLELSRDEAERFKSRRSEIEPAALLARMGALINGNEISVAIPQSGKRDLSRLSQILAEAERFYQGTELRDTFFNGKIMRELGTRGKNRAVIITGGYHAQALSDTLVSQGASVMVVTPKMSAVDRKRTAYYGVISEKLTRGIENSNILPHQLMANAWETLARASGSDLNFPTHVAMGEIRALTRTAGWTPAEVSQFNPASVAKQSFINRSARIDFASAAAQTTSAGFGVGDAGVDHERQIEQAELQRLFKVALENGVQFRFVPGPKPRMYATISIDARAPEDAARQAVMAEQLKAFSNHAKRMGIRVDVQGRWTEGNTFVDIFPDEGILFTLLHISRGGSPVGFGAASTLSLRGRVPREAEAISNRLEIASSPAKELRRTPRNDVPTTGFGTVDRVKVLKLNWGEAKWKVGGRVRGEIQNLLTGFVQNNDFLKTLGIFKKRLPQSADAVSSNGQIRLVTTADFSKRIISVTREVRNRNIEIWISHDAPTPVYKDKQTVLEVPFNIQTGFGARKEKVASSKGQVAGLDLRPATAIESPVTSDDSRSAPAGFGAGSELQTNPFLAGKLRSGGNSLMRLLQVGLIRSFHSREAGLVIANPMLVVGDLAREWLKRRLNDSNFSLDLGEVRLQDGYISLDLGEVRFQNSNISLDFGEVRPHGGEGQLQDSNIAFDLGEVRLQDSNIAFDLGKFRSHGGEGQLQDSNIAFDLGEIALYGIELLKLTLDIFQSFAERAKLAAEVLKDNGPLAVLGKFGTWFRGFAHGGILANGPGFVNFFLSQIKLLNLQRGAVPANMQAPAAGFGASGDRSAPPPKRSEGGGARTLTIDNVRNLLDRKLNGEYSKPDGTSQLRYDLDRNGQLTIAITIFPKHRLWGGELGSVYSDVEAFGETLAMLFGQYNPKPEYSTRQLDGFTIEAVFSPSAGFGALAENAEAWAIHAVGIHLDSVKAKWIAMFAQHNWAPKDRRQKETRYELRILFPTKVRSPEGTPSSTVIISTLSEFRRFRRSFERRIKDVRDLVKKKEWRRAYETLKDFGIEGATEPLWIPVDENLKKVFDEHLIDAKREYDRLLASVEILVSMSATGFGAGMGGDRGGSRKHLRPKAERSVELKKKGTADEVLKRAIAEGVNETLAETRGLKILNNPANRLATVLELEGYGKFELGRLAHIVRPAGAAAKQRPQKPDQVLVFHYVYGTGTGDKFSRLTLFVRANGQMLLTGIGSQNHDHTIIPRVRPVNVSEVLDRYDVLRVQEMNVVTDMSVGPEETGFGAVSQGDKPPSKRSVDGGAAGFGIADAQAGEPIFSNELYDLVGIEAGQTTLSSGTPTVEIVFVLRTKSGVIVRVTGAAASGASAGDREALFLFDGNVAKEWEKSPPADTRVDEYLRPFRDIYGAHVNLQDALKRMKKDDGGKGVKFAVWRAKNVLIPALEQAIRSKELHPAERYSIDKFMLDFEEKNGGDRRLKTFLSGNVTTAMSTAAAKLGAKLNNMEPYEFLSYQMKADESNLELVYPISVFIEGAEHGGWNTDWQEYLFKPHGKTFSEHLQIMRNVYRMLGKLIAEREGKAGVGLESAYLPTVSTNTEPIKLIIEAGIKAGYTPGVDFSIGLDLASSEFHEKRNGKHYYKYSLEGKRNRRIQLRNGTKLGKLETEKSSDGGKQRYLVLTAAEQLQYLLDVIQDPENFISSVEDVFDQDDPAGNRALTKALHDKGFIQTAPLEFQRAGITHVADDISTSNLDVVRAGIEGGTVKVGSSPLVFEEDTMDAILLKLNQAGTVYEIMQLVEYLRLNGRSIAHSHRGGEPPGETIRADVAIASTTYPARPHPVFGTMPLTLVKYGPDAKERAVVYARMLYAYQRSALKLAGFGAQVVKILFADEPGRDETRKAIRKQFAGRAVLLAHKFRQKGPLTKSKALMRVIKTEQPAIVVVRGAEVFLDPEFVTFAKEHGVRAIIRAGSGVDKIDTETARREGITVLKTHGSANSVANVSLRFLLAGLQRLDSEFAGPNPSEIDVSVDERSDLRGVFDVPIIQFWKASQASAPKKSPDGYWKIARFGEIFEANSTERAKQILSKLEGRTIGLVGYGPIAHAFALKLQAIREITGIHFDVIAWTRDPKKHRTEAKKARVTFVDSRFELLARSSIVSIHLPRSADPISEEELKLGVSYKGKLRLIIDTSGGGLISVDLLRGPIREGGIIYISDRDITPEWVDFQAENIGEVFLTPHLGASTDDAAEGVEANLLPTLDIVISAFRNEAPGTSFIPEIVNDTPLVPLAGFGAARLGDKLSSKRSEKVGVRARARERQIYFFGAGQTEGNGKMKGLLGGKGAGLAEMEKELHLRLPPGFTITTAQTLQYFKNGRKFPAGLEQEIDKYLTRLEKIRGEKFGDRDNPLLLSVRSGAAESMPGMMETILNLGLNDVIVEGLARKTQNPRFAYDSYRRLIQMYGEVVLGIDKSRFDSAWNRHKKLRGLIDDTALTADDLKFIVGEFKSIFLEETGKQFPQNPRKQLLGAIKAVFDSSYGEKAVDYRRRNNIPYNIVSAVNVQAMVFGNAGPNSGSGVAFTRDSATGENIFSGEFLVNAQGEDVVAGVRKGIPIEELKNIPGMREAYDELMKIRKILEEHFRDMQDIEFTIERGKLYMLQTRSGKRSAAAMIRIPIELVKAGKITKKQALLRIESERIETELLHPMVDPKAAKKAKLLGAGTAGSPGAAVGQVVFTAKAAAEWAKREKEVILVRKETSADDVAGMAESEGVLTAQGGKTSHAAVVARGEGIPAVVGVDALSVNEKKKTFLLGGVTVKEGDWITIDGSTGKVYLGKVNTIDSEIKRVIKGELDEKKSTVYQNYKQILTWADRFRTTEVWANADSPDDAKLARKLGAEGIGLARTEHMFRDRKDKVTGKVVERRLPFVQAMFLAKEGSRERAKILREIGAMQQRDFEGLLKAMEGLPVTVRLLDPPIHEFLPDVTDTKRIRYLAKRLRITPKEVIKRIKDEHETNPMLGKRGVRLAILNPSIVEMQARAAIEAYVKLIKRGVNAKLKIMIPNVAKVGEIIETLKDLNRVANEIFDRENVKKKYRDALDIGTMIEIPSAALEAEEIAKYADFFSFGTNDLTQGTLMISRDDAARQIIPIWVGKRIFEAGDPTATLDSAVVKLVKMAVGGGRKANPKLSIGCCGEHGGDPRSIQHFLDAGLDYVSASPWRVPVARIASAQWAIRKKAGFGAEIKGSETGILMNDQGLYPSELPPGQTYHAIPLPVMQAAKEKLNRIRNAMRTEAFAGVTEPGRQVLRTNWREWVLPWLDFDSTKMELFKGIGIVLAQPVKTILDADNILLRQHSVIQNIIQIADDIRSRDGRWNEVQAWFNVGIGGSTYPTHALVDMLNGTSHNDMPHRLRGAPKLMYSGDSFSPEVITGKLIALEANGELFKTMFNIISKSGTTAETAGAYLVIREWFQVRLAAISKLFSSRILTDNDLALLGLEQSDLTPIYDVADVKRENPKFKTGRFFVVSTGIPEKPEIKAKIERGTLTDKERKSEGVSALYELNFKKYQGNQRDPFFAMLPVPIGTGGRFSTFPLALLPLAVTANKRKGETPRERVYEAVRGAKAAFKEYFQAEDADASELIPFRTALINYLAEYQLPPEFKKRILDIYAYDEELRGIAMLADELHNEGVVNRGRGLEAKVHIGPNENHLSLEGMTQRPNDRIVWFWQVGKHEPSRNVVIPGDSGIPGEVAAIGGIPLGQIQTFSALGTQRDFAMKGLLNYGWVLPEKTPFYVGAFIYALQTQTAVLGQMTDMITEVHDDGTYVDLTYLQSGVLGYKAQTRELLQKYRDLKGSPLYNAGDAFKGIPIDVDLAALLDAVGIKGVDLGAGFGFQGLLDGIKTLDDIPANEWQGKLVFLRVDFNVPMKDGKISDNARIVATLDTIRHLIQNGARIVLMSHLGRPDAEIKKAIEKDPTLTFDAAKEKVYKKTSLLPVAEELSRLLGGQHVAFHKDLPEVGNATEQAILGMANGSVAMLENLRFHEAEQSKDSAVRTAFARNLYRLPDIIVNDSAANWHNKDASTSNISTDKIRVAGRLIKEEALALTPVIFDPEHPIGFIFGGGPKFEDKVSFLKGIVERSLDGTRGDVLFIGSGPAKAFNEAKTLKAMVDEGGVLPADLDKSVQAGVEILQLAEAKSLPVLNTEDFENADIGPLTRERWQKRLAGQDLTAGEKPFKLIVWNGPPGIFETEESSKGTKAVVDEINQAIGFHGTKVVVLGADTGNASRKFRIDQRAVLSTTGGAALTAIAQGGKKLPGLDALRDAPAAGFGRTEIARQAVVGKTPRTDAVTRKPPRRPAKKEKGFGALTSPVRFAVPGLDGPLVAPVRLANAFRNRLQSDNAREALEAGFGVLIEVGDYLTPPDLGESLTSDALAIVLPRNQISTDRASRVLSLLNTLSPEQILAAVAPNSAALSELENIQQLDQGIATIVSPDGHTVRSVKALDHIDRQRDLVVIPSGDANTTQRDVIAAIRALMQNDHNRLFSLPRRINSGEVQNLGGRIGSLPLGGVIGKNTQATGNLSQLPLVQLTNDRLTVDAEKLAADTSLLQGSLRDVLDRFMYLDTKAYATGGQALRNQIRDILGFTLDSTGNVRVITLDNLFTALEKLALDQRILRAVEQAA